MIQRPLAVLALLWLTWPAAAAQNEAASQSAEPFRFPSATDVQKAGELAGRAVVTRNDEPLGQVHDLAVDLDSGRLAYVVVSVGSFLIEDSLIAVAPSALRESADGVLVLEAEADALRQAQRFSSGDWPLVADVLGSPQSPSAGGSDDSGTEAEPQRGSAVIRSDRRTATLSAGERSIRITDNGPPPDAGAAQTPAATSTAARSGARSGAGESGGSSRFQRLDRNGDGVLNRAEIAHEMTRDVRYGDIDTDGSGDIDPAEFDAFVSSP